jgi:hypothetical protein
MIRDLAPKPTIKHRGEVHASTVLTSAEDIHEKYFPRPFFGSTPVEIFSNRIRVQKLNVGLVLHNSNYLNKPTIANGDEKTNLVRILVYHSPYPLKGSANALEDYTGTTGFDKAFVANQRRDLFAPLSKEKIRVYHDEIVKLGPMLSETQYNSFHVFKTSINVSQIQTYPDQETGIAPLEGEFYVGMVLRDPATDTNTLYGGYHMTLGLEWVEL